MGMGQMQLHSPSQGPYQHQHTGMVPPLAKKQLNFASMGGFTGGGGAAPAPSGWRGGFGGGFAVAAAPAPGGGPAAAAAGGGGSQGGFLPAGMGGAQAAWGAAAAEYRCPDSCDDDVLCPPLFLRASLGSSALFVLSHLWYLVCNAVRETSY